MELHRLVAEPDAAPPFPLSECYGEGRRDGESWWGLDVREGSRRGRSVWFAPRVPRVLEMVQEREADSSEGLDKVPGCLSLIRGKAGPLPDSCVVLVLLLRGSVHKAISCPWGGMGARWGCAGCSWTPSTWAGSSVQGGKPSQDLGDGAAAQRRTAAFLSPLEGRRVRREPEWGWLPELGEGVSPSHHPGPERPQRPSRALHLCSWLTGAEARLWPWGWVGGGNREALTTKSPWQELRMEGEHRCALDLPQLFNKQ